MLTISNITASFVIGKTNNEKIYISGRSIGDINVLNHIRKNGRRRTYDSSRTQIKNIEIEDAKKELINKINEYFNEMA
jgi:c-di-AMP phosphodiesterase-like protein